ncbi:MAG: HAD family hydrolase [Halobacteriota archaeon]
MRYDAVLFDNDGVLVHLTELPVLRRAVERAFAEMGVEDPDEGDVEALTIGVTPETLEAVSDEYDLDPEAFWVRRDQHATNAQQRAVETGEKALYEDFESVLDIPLPRGIVSSNQHPTVEHVLEFNEVDDHFETYYGREMSVDGLRRKKPATYYLDRAIADIGAENPVYVGDSESDVVAAQNAGMDSVFVRREHRADLDLSVEPTAEISSLTALPTVVNGRE